MGMWHDIKPLSPRRSEGEWVFALYYETPDERADNLWYEAFLFRNDDRTVFGRRETTGSHLRHVHDYRAMATRIMNDRDFRKSLISDDPDLPRMWKRH